MVHAEERPKWRTISLIVPHPHLFSRGEWLGFGVGKVLRSTLLVIRPLPVRPFVSLLLYNVIALILFLIKRKRYHIALVFNCMIFPIAYFLKKLNLITLLVYDDADYLPIFAEGLIGKKLMSMLEDFAVSKSDMVISASEVLARLRKSKNPATYVVENGFSKRLCRDIARDRISTNNCNFVYVGNINFVYASLDTVVKAFKASEALKGSKLYIAGRGKDTPRLREMIAELDNVVLTSYANVTQQLLILEKCIFGIAPYHIRGSAMLGVPLKVKEYLASGICVIVSDIKPIVDFIESVNGCYYVIKDPSDVEHVKRVMEEALTSCTREGESLLRKIESSSIKVCDLYSWDKLIVKYVTYVNKLVKEFRSQKEARPGESAR